MPSAHADNDRKRRRDTISAGMLQALSHANIQFFFQLEEECRVECADSQWNINIAVCSAQQ